MKKINFFTSVLIIFFALISCKGTNEDKSEVENINKENETVITDCGCEELVMTDEDGKLISKGIKKNGIEGLFSGNCIEKDINDSIIKRLEIKNGFISREIKRQKIIAKYETTTDVNYEYYPNGSRYVVNGYEKRISDNDEAFYVNYCNVIKNKKTIDEYEASFYPNSQGGKTIIVSQQTKNGELKLDMHKPECMDEAKFIASYGSLSAEYKVEDISPEEAENIIGCLKKELPMFNVWKK